MDDEAKFWKSPNRPLSKEIIKPGTGYIKPVDRSVCMVTLVQTEGPPLTHNILGYVLGENIEIQIGEGDTLASDYIDECLESMKQDELCEIKFELPNSSSLKDNEIHKYKCNMQLHKFLSPPYTWKMSPGEKLSIAQHHRKKGTELFNQGNIEFSFRRYSKALKYLICMYPEDEIPENLLTEYLNLKAVVYANMSACQAKYSHHEFVVANCTSALLIEPNNLKALYRRAQALLCLKDFDQALEDVHAALKIEPDNRALHKLMKETEKKIKDCDNEMKQAMAKMFPPSHS